jgi:hypothetical protein
MKNLNSIADAMIKEGTENTHYGNWTYCYDEAYGGVFLGNLEEDEIKTLVEILEGREEVAEVDVDFDEGFIDIDFWLMYCPQVEDEDEYADDDEEEEQ